MDVKHNVVSDEERMRCVFESVSQSVRVTGEGLTDIQSTDGLTATGECPAATQQPSSQPSSARNRSASATSQLHITSVYQHVHQCSQKILYVFNSRFFKVFKSKIWEVQNMFFKFSLFFSENYKFKLFSGDLD